MDFERFKERWKNVEQRVRYESNNPKPKPRVEPEEVDLSNLKKSTPSPYNNPFYKKPMQETVGNVLSGLNKFSDSATLGLLPMIQKKQYDKDKQNPLLQPYDITKAKDNLYKENLQDPTRGNEISKLIGNFAGYALPGFGIEKGLASLTKGIGSGLARNTVLSAGTGAITEGTMGLTETIKNDDRFTLDNAINRGLQGALYGGAFGLGTGLLGKGAKALANKLTAPPTPQATPLMPPNNLLATPKPFVLSSNKPQGKFKFKTGNVLDQPQTTIPNTPRQPINNMESILRPINQADNIKPPTTINEPVRNQSRVITSNDIKPQRGNIPPRQTNNVNEIPSPNRKERRFASNSFQESDVPTQQMKRDMPKQYYEPITNKETLEGAFKRVDADYDGSVREFLTTDKLKTADDTAFGEAIIQRAVAKGNYSEANDVAINLAEKLTSAGQVVQAASIFKRMTPEGMLRYANKIINKANAQNAGKKGFQNIKLTNAEVKKITDNMAEVNKAMKNEMINIDFDLQMFANTKLAEVFKIIQTKLPANVAQQLKGIQRINLLLNPTTMMRNFTGNVGSYAVTNLTDLVASGIDKGISKITGKRTVIAPQFKKQFQGAKKGAQRIRSDWRNDVNTSPTGTQYELSEFNEASSPFKNKVLKKLDKLTTTGLRWGDDPFYQAYYDDILSREMQLNNVVNPTDEMIKKADQIARERTFQDKNMLSDAILGIRRTINKITGSSEFGLGNLIIPFGKTPANILARAVEYSPAQIFNLFKVAGKVATNKGFDQRLFVESLAKGLTGSGLVWAGYELAKKGLALGKAPNDKDAREFQKATGYSPYSIKIGDSTYTFDWAQPYAIPFSMGVDMFNSVKNKKNTDSAVLEALVSGGDTLFSQSMLQGLNRAFGGSKYPTGKGMTENLTDTALSATSQFIPLASASKKISDIVVPYSRDTKSDSPTEKYITNQVKNTYPFLRGSLPVRTDVLGNKVEGYNKPDLLAPLRTLKPYISKQMQKDGTIDEINRLYETGQTMQFPRVASDTISYKTSKKSESEKLKLNREEFNQFQETFGKESMQEISKVIKRSDYKRANDKQKAKLISDAMSEVKQEVEKKTLELKGIKEYKALKTLSSGRTRSRGRR